MQGLLSRMRWRVPSEGRVAAAVHDVFLGDTLVLILRGGLAPIVTIECCPYHVPLFLRVFAALKPAGQRALVHFCDERLELLAVDYTIAIAVDLVPRIVHLLLESFTVRNAAFFIVWDAQGRLEGLLGLLLGLSEGLLPVPDIVLQGLEEIFLALELLRSEQICAVPRLALLPLLLLLLALCAAFDGDLRVIDISRHLALLLCGGLVVSGGLGLCGFVLRHSV